MKPGETIGVAIVDPPVLDARGRAASLATLFASLAAAPREHDFFAVLRHVEALRLEDPRLGEALRPQQEGIRLGQLAELNFAPAALESFELDAQPAPRLGVRFFGLLGPQGPMPLHFTEYVRERLRHRGDATLARFLDVFHHRLLTLFYRAWSQAQPTAQHDRPDDDRFAVWLGASFGARQGRASSLPATSPLHQAGLLGARSRHPEGLGKVLRQYFRVPVRIEQHVPQWLALEGEDRSRLGFARNLGERSRFPAPRLGRSSTSGGRWLDRQFKFRLVVGPLALARYLDFLPGGSAWSRLSEWVVQYTGLDLRWDVQLVLARAEVPAPRLGDGVRLGVTTWIGRSTSPSDRGDLRLRPATSSLLRHGARHA